MDLSVYEKATIAISALSLTLICLYEQKSKAEEIVTSLGIRIESIQHQIKELES